jgi:hypothetical protein
MLAELHPRKRWFINYLKSPLFLVFSMPVTGVAVGIPCISAILNLR